MKPYAFVTGRFQRLATVRTALPVFITCIGTVRANYERHPKTGHQHPIRLRPAEGGKVSAKIRFLEV